STESGLFLCLWSRSVSPFLKTYVTDLTGWLVFFPDQKILPGDDPEFVIGTKVISRGEHLLKFIQVDRSAGIARIDPNWKKSCLSWQVFILIMDFAQWSVRNKFNR